MAINPVQIFNAPDVDKSRKAREGGGKKGQMVGAAAGAIIGGAATGGAGAAQGAALGSSIGQVAGEAVDPSRAGNTAIQRRIATQGPQIVHSPQSDQLKQSLVAMQTQPPEVQKEYMAPLVKAYVKSVSDDNPRGIA